jgi:hypothetical protein
MYQTESSNEGTLSIKGISAKNLQRAVDSLQRVAGALMG